jgi:hypothetical protein
MADPVTSNKIDLQVGFPTDIANALGTLHAKVADIVANQLPLSQRPRQAQPGGSFSTTSTSPVTALSVTGKGKLNAFYLNNTSASYGTQYSIIVDEVATIGGFSGLRTGTFYPLPIFLTTNSSSITTVDTIANGGSMMNMGNGISFKTSLIIQVNVTASSSTGTVYWQYEKE